MVDQFCTKINSRQSSEKNEEGVVDDEILHTATKIRVQLKRTINERYGKSSHNRALQHWIWGEKL